MIEIIEAIVQEEITEEIIEVVIIKEVEVIIQEIITRYLITMEEAVTLAMIITAEMNLVMETEICSKESLIIVVVMKQIVQVLILKQINQMKFNMELEEM